MALMDMCLHNGVELQYPIYMKSVCNTQNFDFN